MKYTDYQIVTPYIIKKVEMYGIEIPISTYRTQGAITFKVLSLKHTEISASRYFLCYKKVEMYGIEVPISTYHLQGDFFETYENIYKSIFPIL